MAAWLRGVALSVFGFRASGEGVTMHHGYRGGARDVDGRPLTTCVILFGRGEGTIARAVCDIFHTAAHPSHITVAIVMVPRGDGPEGDRSAIRGGVDVAYAAECMERGHTARMTQVRVCPSQLCVSADACTWAPQLAAAYRHEDLVLTVWDHVRLSHGWDRTLCEDLRSCQQMAQSPQVCIVARKSPNRDGILHATVPTPGGPLPLDIRQYPESCSRFVHAPWYTSEMSFAHGGWARDVMVPCTGTPFPALDVAVGARMHAGGWKCFMVQPCPIINHGIPPYRTTTDEEPRNTDGSRRDDVAAYVNSRGRDDL